MTATERLRELLDERGVEWEADDAQVDGNGTTYYVTYVKKGYGRTWVYEEPPNCDLLISYDHDLGAEDAIDATLGQRVTGDTSDGYHTFNDLYHHRAVLFSVIVRVHPDIAWKSKKHHDGTMYEGMFIVGVDTPVGQATYHYDIDPYWDIFACKELERAPEWDGHTPTDAIERIALLGCEEYQKCHATGWSYRNCKYSINRGWCDDTCHPIISDNLNESEGTGDAWANCSECGDLLFVLTDPTSTKPNFCPNCGRRVVE